MTIRCGICGRDFATEEELRAHEHEPDTAVDDALACQVCGERFDREELLVRHQTDDHVGLDAPDDEHAVP